MRKLPGTPLFASNKMLELCRALGYGTIPGPMTDGKDVITIVARVEFEPFGRASEAWEIVWILTLDRVRHHWRATDGWREGTDPTAPMTFRGIDDGDVMTKALQFLRDVPKPGARLDKRPAAISADALNEE